MRRLLALVLLLRHARAQECDSLNGPRCYLVNGLEPFERREEPERVSSSWRERLLELVGEHLATAGLSGGAPSVSGAFEIGGDLPDEDGAFDLVAGEWLEQPDGWITVGLRGRFEDNRTLTGEIMDEDGDKLEACSSFTLQRADDGVPRGEDDRASLAGEWEGVYICAGTPTRLVLTLEADHEVLPKSVAGTFKFRVLDALNEYELEEITRLVGESLLDVTGVEGADNIIIIDGEIVDPAEFVGDI